MFSAFAFGIEPKIEVRDEGSHTTKGRATDRLGGPGVEDNRVVRQAGGTTCLTCAHSDSEFRFRSIVVLYLNAFGLILKSKLHRIAQNLRPHSCSRFAAITGSLLLASCATSGKLASQERRVLESQNRLLQKIRVERAHPGLLKKLEQDNDVWTAEMNLRNGIDSLMNANEELKRTVEQR